VPPHHLSRALARTEYSARPENLTIHLSAVGFKHMNIQMHFHSSQNIKRAIFMAYVDDSTVRKTTKFLQITLCTPQNVTI